MARDRQRAKQRQAERRAARMAARRDAKGRSAERDGDPARGDGDPAARRDAAPLDEPSPADLTEIESSAPREDLGHSDSFVAAQEPPEVDELDEFVDEELAFDAEQAEAEDPAVHERPREERSRRGRVLTFLVACWAELQRVQWPKRPALTQLTGVVLFFVLLAGGYLGLLDAIFSRVIQAII